MERRKERRKERMKASISQSHVHCVVTLIDGVARFELLLNIDGFFKLPATCGKSLRDRIGFCDAWR